MKKALLVTLLASSTLLNGCLALSLGSGDKREVQNPTVGQQLIDLKTAKDNGAITEEEYQQQKTKLLNGK
jgi:hypothetical protein